MMKMDIKRRMEENLIIKDKDVICQYPKNMLLEPTNACNDSCLFCANSKCTKNRGVIDSELAKSILEQAYELGTREVGFYGTGEPLLDRNLERYIEYAKHLGYEYVYITTNGALMNEERAISILDAGIDSIKFSINASNAKDYFFIHGKDEFDNVIKNLVFVDSLRKKYRKKIALYISYVVTRYTNIDKEIFKKKYQEYVDDIVFYDCANTAGCMTNEIDQYLSLGNNSAYHPQDSICPMIFKTFYITCEGYLTMCCEDFQNYLVIADLGEETLKEAWNNQYARGLRKKHLEHDLKGTLCFNCMNNCNGSVSPLRDEYAVRYSNAAWDKSQVIADRINRWKNA